MHLAFIGLGSNIGDRHGFLRTAVSELNARCGVVLQQSQIYSTLPVGFVSDNVFLNQVVALATNYSAKQVLSITQGIEKDMGRTQKSVAGRHFDRTIDIDLLCYDSLHISTPDLVLPHPHIAERPFVFLPMQELTTEHF